MDATKPKPHQTQTERRASARAKILAAAIELIGERGLDGFTLREVSVRAGKSPSLTSHYFPTKVELLDAAARELLRPATAPDASEKMGLAKVITALRSGLAAELGDPVKARARLAFMTEIHGASRFGAAVAGYFRSRVPEIAAHLEAGCAAGDVRSVDSQAQALAMLAMHRGVVLLALTVGVEAERARLIDAYIETVRRGLAA